MRHFIDSPRRSACVCEMVILIAIHHLLVLTTVYECGICIILYIRESITGSKNRVPP
ncbi:hypothetical protein P691DRAFT_355347 [Macrolepiota fuliginosa MF-IS2]|uniref:Uncharacterized protein n=1 Tax=Macrolepiota fuliginosa MF-IS2 TaxID=1400762 RepID=A0A9P5XL53_9AGAR|nr:hypothetical protein P691DRAFT_355347 [Macrolepiota fuliginosa MF-IS2]